MNIIKIVKRIIIGVFLFMLLLAGTVAILSRVYQDEIIGYFLKEANKRIDTPVDVVKIEISAFDYFPNISISLHHVTIKESNNDHQGTLGKIKHVGLTFNVFDFLNKKYTIKGLHLSDAELNLRIDRNGEPNYLFYKKDSAEAGGMFALKNVSCNNIKIDYLDQKTDYHVAAYVKNTNFRLTRRDNQLKVSASGSMVSDEIKVDRRRFLDNKEINFDTEFALDLKDRVYEFKSGKLEIGKGEFDVRGTVDMAKNDLELKFTGVNTTFQTINSILSADLSKYFNAYKSKGEVYFNGEVKGNYGAASSLHTTFTFGAVNASFFHPQYRKQITDVNLKGDFSTGRSNKPSDYKLNIENFSCQLDDKRLTGRMSLQNFSDYRIDLSLKGEADVNTLLLFLPKKYVKTAFGTMKMDFHLAGKLDKPRFTKNLTASGEVELKNISFVLLGEKLPFNKINGVLMLQQNDLAISELTGFVGSSHFNFNGYLKNLDKIIAAKKREYTLQADLQSKYLDFDELLKSNFASRDTSKNDSYEFNISPDISLDFNCEVDRVKFKRFHGRKMRGQVDINRQIAVLENIFFQSMGGEVNVSGSVNSKRGNLVETISEINLNNIDVDSIFYVFKNFNQNWLVDKNLKGQIDADIYLYMNFDKKLVLNSKSLTADIQTTIANGQLNDFEPMMKLSKFVEEESLAQMRFSRMTNDIRIENRTIYLPEMEIRSNVSNILISGTHSFDKQIDYHLKVPLKSFIRIGKRRGYSENARNGMNLLLKITGNTTDYKISFDTGAMKESLTKDILDEGSEWKQIRDKDSRIDDTPILEEEYFDFEESANDSLN